MIQCEIMKGQMWLIPFAMTLMKFPYFGIMLGLHRAYLSSFCVELQNI